MFQCDDAPDDQIKGLSEAPWEEAQHEYDDSGKRHMFHRFDVWKPLKVLAQEHNAKRGSDRTEQCAEATH